MVSGKCDARRLAASIATPTNPVQLAAAVLSTCSVSFYTRADARIRTLLRTSTSSRAWGVSDAPCSMEKFLAKCCYTRCLVKTISWNSEDSRRLLHINWSIFISFVNPKEFKISSISQVWVTIDSTLGIARMPNIHQSANF